MIDAIEQMLAVAVARYSQQRMGGIAVAYRYSGGWVHLPAVES